MTVEGGKLKVARVHFQLATFDFLPALPPENDLSEVLSRLASVVQDHRARRYRPLAIKDISTQRSSAC
jgi:hypothetical protein